MIRAANRNSHLMLAVITFNFESIRINLRKRLLNWCFLILKVIMPNNASLKKHCGKILILIGNLKLSI